MKRPRHERRRQKISIDAAAQTVHSIDHQYGPNGIVHPPPIDVDTRFT
jgi:hypothetical protein